jgi:hypothetical protein
MHLRSKERNIFYVVHCLASAQTEIHARRKRLPRHAVFSYAVQLQHEAATHHSHGGIAASDANSAPAAAVASKVRALQL